MIYLKDYTFLKKFLGKNSQVLKPSLKTVLERIKVVTNNQQSLSTESIGEEVFIFSPSGKIETLFKELEQVKSISDYLTLMFESKGFILDCVIFNKEYSSKGSYEKLSYIYLVLGWYLYQKNRISCFEFTELNFSASSYTEFIRGL